jgi:potassium efflux system protein
MSIMGNVYTSTKLASLLLDTAWLALGLVIVNMVVLRWLALSHRKLALKMLLQQREAQKAEREAGEQPGSEGEAPAATTAPLDLDTVDIQSRKLIRLGLVFVAVIIGWRIWSEILPALTLLNDVSLWSKKDVVDGVEIIAAVTLADLLLSFLVIVVAIVAARNLPGFIELAIPRSLAVERGSRYAINTLVRYFIIMVGVVTVLNLVGWRWSQIQWLVAALSVGLGFGLRDPVRTASEGWRYDHGRSAIGHRVANSYSCHDYCRLGSQRNNCSEQVIYYRTGS